MECLPKVFSEEDGTTVLLASLSGLIVGAGTQSADDGVASLLVISVLLALSSETSVHVTNDGLIVVDNTGDGVVVVVVVVVALVVVVVLVVVVAGVVVFVVKVAFSVVEGFGTFTISAVGFGLGRGALAVVATGKGELVVVTVDSDSVVAFDNLVAVAVVLIIGRLVGFGLPFKVVLLLL